LSAARKIAGTAALVAPKRATRDADMNNRKWSDSFRISDI
jgi:hypothetical protein